MSAMTRQQETALSRAVASLTCPECGARKALLPARADGGEPRWDAASCTRCYVSVPIRLDVVARERRTVVWDVTPTIDPSDSGVHVDTSRITVEADQ